MELWLRCPVCRYDTGFRGGPRSTPTFHNGVLYSVGGLGQVSSIDASDGSLIWKRDLLADTNGEVPQWGYSTSAFVDDRFCIVTGNGEGSESVDTICYDSKTGAIQWAGVGSGLSYSSPQVVELFGKRQVLSMIAQTKSEKKGTILLVATMRRVSCFGVIEVKRPQCHGDSSFYPARSDSDGGWK